MSKPKLLFVYDHPKPDWWRDGLWAALGVLEEHFELTRLRGFSDRAIYELDPNQYDFVLGWGAFGSKVDIALQLYKGEKGLCVAGNATPTDGADKYDVLFYETDWINDNYLPEHPNKVKAFGTNADLYFENPFNATILFDYIGVGAFALWKHWEKFTEKKGNRLVIGEYQEGNEEESLSIVRNLVRNGVMTSPMIPPFELARFYQCSRTAYIPADTIGGGERAILEARASGCEVEIDPDNKKLQELVDMEKVPDHRDYALALRQGIESVL